MICFDESNLVVILEERLHNRLLSGTLSEPVLQLGRVPHAECRQLQVAQLAHELASEHVQMVGRWAQVDRSRDVQKRVLDLQPETYWCMCTVYVTVHNSTNEHNHVTISQCINTSPMPYTCIIRVYAKQPQSQQTL